MSSFKVTVQRAPSGEGTRLGAIWQPQYEEGLLNRGSLTVWLGMVDGKLNHWDAPKPRRPKPGRQRQYSEQAIGTAVNISMVFAQVLLDATEVIVRFVELLRITPTGFAQTPDLRPKTIATDACSVSF